MTTENGVTVKETEFEVTAHLDGFPVTVKFTGNGRKLKEVIAGLKQSGAVPPPIRSFGGGGFGGKKPDDRTKVAFDEGGREICPLHKKPLSKREWNGSFFWSCPAKADSSGPPNQKPAVNFYGRRWRKQERPLTFLLPAQHGADAR
jgi:hypothetical protein